jgi:hypothetical protein
MTLKGLFAVWRVNALDAVRWDVAPLGLPQADLGSVATRVAGGGAALRLGVALAVAAAIAVFVFASRDFRSSRELTMGGIVVGAVIVGGWFVSGHLG